MKRARLAITLSVLLAVAACSGERTPTNQGRSRGPGELVIVNPGGSLAQAINAAFLQPFENETGIKIRSVEGGDDPIAAVQAQVKSGNVQWDLVACVQESVIAFPEIWEQIDPTIVKSAGGLVYNLDQSVARYFSMNTLQAFLVAYSKKAFPGRGPSSWKDFFDVKTFPGPRGVPNIGLESATNLPVVALLADGVAPKDLLPLDLDRAYAKLDELKPHIRVFWTTFGQSQDILRAGEVAVNFMADGRAGQLIAAGSPVGISFNQALSVVGGYCVPKNAPNKENAFRLLEYILSHPKQQAVLTSLTFYGPPTKGGVAAAQDLGVTDFTSLHVDEMVPQSSELVKYFQDHSDELLRRWNAWVGS